MLDNHKQGQFKTKHYILRKAIKPGSISTLTLIKYRGNKGNKEAIIHKPQTE